MLNAFFNCLKIPELRQRIFFTLGLIFVARVGANIPLPGFNPGPLQDYFASAADAEGGLVGLYNMFTGGALLNGAIFGLGIMPYISASIILQLMGAVVPALARLQQEGETGRQKIAQYTRYLTIGIALVQSLLLSIALVNNPGSVLGGFDPVKFGNIIILSSTWFIFTAVIFLTAGTTLLMWMGEQITQRGIGNGVSLLITIGILADLPGAVSQLYTLFNAPAGVADEFKMGAPQGFLLLILFVVVIAGIVAITQAQRKIPVQYAKRVVGRKVYGGQSSFLPLKVNYSGVMPVIFASAILMFPSMILSQIGGATDITEFESIAAFFSPPEPAYFITFSVLILGFSYFWVSIMFKPIQIADDLKKNGGYIPGVRPGQPTASFLDFVMTRLTLAGAIFLTVIAVMPMVLADQYKIPMKVSNFIGGTGTLIAVGVMLDTMRQIETFLLQRHYDGFLKKGKSRSRSRMSNRASQFVDTGEMKNLGALWLPLGFLFVVGIGSWVINEFVLKTN